MKCRFNGNRWFQEYESDFETDSSVDSEPGPEPLRAKIDGERTASDGPVSADKFALPVYVEEKLEPFLDEKFEINSLENTVELGIKNFMTAGKRKREQEV